MLVLPIKKKWFDMIKSGKKKEEYREIKPYWTTRLNNDLNEKNRKLIDVEKDLRRYPLWTEAIFRNGYRKDSPQLKCKVKIKIGQGKEEWGAEKRKRILYIRNFGGRAMLNKEEIESNRISKQIAKALRNRKRGQ